MDPEGPKTWGSGSGSRSPTLLDAILFTKYCGSGSAEIRIKLKRKEYNKKE
jgi:hypothetical protein